VVSVTEKERKQEEDPHHVDGRGGRTNQWICKPSGKGAIVKTKEDYSIYRRSRVKEKTQSKFKRKKKNSEGAIRWTAGDAAS